MSFCFLQTRRC